MPGSGNLIGWLGEHPEFIAVLLVLAGFLIARMVRHGIRLFVPWLNRRASRLGPDRGALVSPAFQNALQLVAFWGILLTALIAALYFLGGGAVTGWLDGLLATVPQFLIALAILAVGHLLGLLARSVLSKHTAGRERQAIPTLAYAVILGTAAITAVEHLGVQVSFLTHFLLVIVAVFLAGLALAFALGARTLVANLAAQGELQRYQVGDRLRIEDIEGTVVELHRTGVVLSTADGLAAVPAHKLATTTVIEVQAEKAEGG